MVHSQFVLQLQQDSWQPANGSPCPLTIREQFPQVVEIVAFFQSNQKELKRQTSGSTGKPKTISISKKQLIASAAMTINYLRLREKDYGLLCLNASFIGGTMMVVRALVAGMRLIIMPATANPLTALEVAQPITLAAMVPMQVMEIVKNGNEESIRLLQSIKNIIIGGAAIDGTLLHRLSNFPNNIYSTFGMTETISHFALKMIAPQQKEYFETLPGIEIEIEENDCLKVKGEVTNNNWLITNDLITLIDSNKFIWKGRSDHVINSGGIKIQPEILEAKIKALVAEEYLDVAYFVGSQADERLGNRVVIYIEGKKNIAMEHYLQEQIFVQLDRYEKPKNILWIEKFDITASGKINRLNTIKHLLHDNSQ